MTLTERFAQEEDRNQKARAYDELIAMRELEGARRQGASQAEAEIAQYLYNNVYEPQGQMMGAQDAGTYANGLAESLTRDPRGLPEGMATEHARDNMPTPEMPIDVDVSEIGYAEAVRRGLIK